MTVRAAGLVALVVALVSVVLIVTGSGGSYTLNARFENSGGLVEGGLVEVAGRPVGSIAAITLTPSGEANVKMTITDGSLTPLHLGTRADIRDVGQGTIDNNYVLLSPGTSTRPAIRNGGVLPLTQTTGIVDIDALFDSFGAPQRREFDNLIADSSQMYAGSSGRNFNEMLSELYPSLGRFEDFGDELNLDRPAISELVKTAAIASQEVADRTSELQQSLSNTAAGLGALARQSGPLDDALTRMPGFLAQTQVTFARTSRAVQEAAPALRDTPAADTALAGVLRTTDATLPTISDATAQLDAQLPGLDKGLTGAVPLAKPTITAFKALGPAMRKALPILTGLRFYGTDFVLGLLAGVAALTTSEYDSLGHYIKINFVQSPQTLISGSLSKLLTEFPLVPGILDTHTNLTRRCPGGSEPPAPDGSSPWLIGSKYCDASQDDPLSVDQP